MRVPFRSPEAELVAADVAAAGVLAVVLVTGPDGVGAASSAATPNRRVPCSSSSAAPACRPVRRRAVAARSRGAVRALGPDGVSADVHAEVEHLRAPAAVGAPDDSSPVLLVDSNRVPHIVAVALQQFRPRACRRRRLADGGA